MNRYRCLIREADGRLVQQELAADSLNAAFDQLASEGKQIESIQLVQEPLAQETATESVDDIDLSAEIEQLIPLLREAADEFQERQLSNELLAINKVLEKKKRLLELLNDPLAVVTVPLLLRFRSGGVQTETVLSWIEQRLAQQDVLVNHRFGLSYPLFFLGLAGGVFIFLSLLVLPIFEDMIKEFDLQIPEVTEALFTAGHQISKHGLRTALIGVIVVAAAWWFGKRLSRWLRDSATFGFFYTGSRFRLESMSRFTATLAELLQLSVALPAAIRLAAMSCHDMFLHRACLRLASLSEADTWRHNWFAEPALPATLITTLKVTETQSAQAAILRQLSSIYAERQGDRINMWHTLVPMIAVLAVGIFVGFMLIALFMPLVSLISGLSG